MSSHTEYGVFVRFSKMMENKNILIGVTGGIAAFKICELIRKFKKQVQMLKSFVLLML